MRQLFFIITLLFTNNMIQASNPFLSKYRTPYSTAPFDKIKTEHYEPAFEAGIRQHQQEIDAIVNQRSTPTFENTIEALDRSGDLLTRVSSVFFALLSAESNDEMMEISQRISPKLSEHSNNINLNEGLFQRVKAVYDNREEMNLTPEQTMLLTETYNGFVRSGANLSGTDKERYRQLSSELSQLTLTFGQNVLKETNRFSMLLTDKKELEGLPQDIIEAAAELAREEGKEGWLFNLSYPSYVPFMKYSSRRDLREKMYRAYNSRCTGGEYNNLDIMKRIAEVRLEIARLMGKNTYAEYALERRMAQNSQNVYNLLNQLLEAYTPTALQEVKEVQGFAIGKEGRNITLMPWDWSYYADKLKDAKYDLNDEMLKPYFELENVKKGIFGLATDLYGITFQKNEAIPVYHPEVEAFEVKDADGRMLAILYTDFHPRSGKRSGAWMTEFKGQWREKNGEDSRPHITIVMNFSRPSGNQPALLTYDEVETFIHEFGHALHGMFANTTYPSLSGTNVYRDFVELPSQIMENWLSEKDFLDRFAVHYQSGEKIPEALVQKIRDAGNFNVGYACLRQLSFGLLDMAWHTITAPIDTDVATFEKKATASTQILPAVEGAVTGAQFSHIFSGGYAAGYYSYKWAEVLDADAFALFKERGIFDKETATSFRKNILEKGGTEPPMELYKRFRGSEPSIEALMRRDGILP
ncbi:MAG TPA: M3 family metallopeptidase [Candidatus Gallibacteroides avistercoris]|uniref:M3 family metallopeptidase n=1 Tax=Candidatus Gallibacteroides avistercoris TaxID=2840833 RepID=A0A9D1M8R6_9BACT|nr:M3 family metallopeptidase [Candidatus Gallibacteroides avistercoris]